MKQKHGATIKNHRECSPRTSLFELNDYMMFLGSCDYLLDGDKLDLYFDHECNEFIYVRMNNGAKQIKELTMDMVEHIYSRVFRHKCDPRAFYMHVYAMVFLLSNRERIMVRDPTIHLMPDDSTIWMLNGKIHREGGPAVIRSSGAKYWYINDKLHREDGPAIDGPYKSWFLNGRQITEDEHKKATKKSA